MGVFVKHFTAGESGDAYGPVSIACFLLTLLLSLIHIFLHVKHFNSPNLQRLYCRIIFAPIVYSFDSMFVLSLGRWAMVLDFVRDFYEAYVFYCFANVLIEFAGGEAAFINLLDDDSKRRLIAVRNRLGTLCCCFYSAFTSGRAFVSYVHFAMTQFLIFKPTFSAILAAIDIKTYYHEHNRPSSHYFKVSWAFRILTAITLVIALHAVLSTYKLGYDRIQGKGALKKLISVKALVAVTIIQRIVVDGLADRHKLHGNSHYTENELSLRTQYLLISLEMVIFSLFFFFIFSYSDFTTVSQEKSSQLTTGEKWGMILKLTDVSGKKKSVAPSGQEMS